MSICRQCTKQLTPIEVVRRQCSVCHAVVEPIAPRTFACDDGVQMLPSASEDRRPTRRPRWLVVLVAALVFIVTTAVGTLVLRALR